MVDQSSSAPSEPFALDRCRHCGRRLSPYWRRWCGHCGLPISPDDDGMRRPSDFGLREFGAPFIVGTLGGIVSGTAVGVSGTVLAAGLLVTGLVASLAGRGMVGFIALSLAAPVSFLAGLLMALGTDSLSGDMSHIVISGSLSIALAVTGSAYALGRIMVGPVKRAASRIPRR